MSDAHCSIRGIFVEIRMIDELSLIIMLIGVVLFIVITYLHSEFENSINKIL